MDRIDLGKRKIHKKKKKKKKKLDAMVTYANT
jgi:hypothetical protein